MTKRVLLTSIVALFAFSGCLSTDNAKPSVEKIKNTTKKVEDTTTKATSAVKDTTVKIENAITVEEEVSIPPESSLKDKAIDKAVEVADEHTDGMATKVIESVQ